MGLEEKVADVKIPQDDHLPEYKQVCGFWRRMRHYVKGTKNNAVHYINTLNDMEKDQIKEEFLNPHNEEYRLIDPNKYFKARGWRGRFYKTTSIQKIIQSFKEEMTSIKSHFSYSKRRY